MPVYEYRCQACGHVFEELVFHGQEPAACPRCEGEIRKLVSAFNAQSADDVCSKLPKGEQRELCTACRQGGSACPLSA